MKMCCDRRTHVIILSSVLLGVTGCSYILYVFRYLSLMISQRVTTPTDNLDTMGIPIAIFVFILITEILCIVGAVKNNKCLLIPIMIYLVLQIFAGIGLTIFLGVYFGPTVLMALFVISMIMAVGISTYTLTIVIKFYRELSFGIACGEQTGLELLVE